LGKVLIRDLVVRGIIGIRPDERDVPQEILINLELETDLRRPGETDDIADCLDYQKVVEQVTAHTASVGRFTVEALATDLARLCLSEPAVMRVRVRVEKPAAIASCRSVGVELEGSRPTTG
jgi:FolB domain-containing protein